MAQRKTLDAQIETAQEKLRQEENRLKTLLQKQKQAERNARTKRLVERGAITESLIPGADALTNEQFKAFLTKTITTSFAVKTLDEITAQTANDTGETKNPQGQAD